MQKNLKNRCVTGWIYHNYMENKVNKVLNYRDLALEGFRVKKQLNQLL
jgi:hypothetical protein